MGTAKGTVVPSPLSGRSPATPLMSSRLWPMAHGMDDIARVPGLWADGPSRTHGCPLLIAHRHRSRAGVDEIGRCRARRQIP